MACEGFEVSLAPEQVAELRASLTGAVSGEMQRAVAALREQLQQDLRAHLSEATAAPALSEGRGLCRTCAGCGQLTRAEAPRPEASYRHEAESVLSDFAQSIGSSRGFSKPKPKVSDTMPSIQEFEVQGKKQRLELRQTTHGRLIVGGAVEEAESLTEIAHLPSEPPPIPPTVPGVVMAPGDDAENLNVCDDDAAVAKGAAFSSDRRSSNQDTLQKITRAVLFNSEGESIDEAGMQMQSCSVDNHRKSIATRVALTLSKKERSRNADQKVVQASLFHNARDFKSGILAGLDGNVDTEDYSPSCWELVCLFVKSDFFDYIVSTLLIANAVTIGVSTEYKAQHHNAPLPAHLRNLDRVFCILFTLELCLRITVSKLQFFIGADRRWNWFDAVLVTLQLVEEIATLFWQEESATTESSVLDVVKFLRFLRLLRIIRVMRLVRFVAELRKLTYLIVASFWSFIWTIVLLGMLTYMVAVFVTQLVVDSASQPDSRVSSDGRIIFWFGGIVDTVNSLYQAITGGVDWGEMSHALMTHVNPWCGILFYMYVAFSVLVLLNLVTGVFVDGAMRLTKSDRQAELVRKIHRAFQMSDSDGSGTISFGEFKSRIEAEDVRTLFAAIDMNISRAEDLFKILDEDDSGELTAEEFAMGSLQLQAPAKALDLCLMTHQMARGFDNIRRCFELILTDKLPVWANCQGITGVVDRYRMSEGEGPIGPGGLRQQRRSMGSDEGVLGQQERTAPGLGLGFRHGGSALPGIIAHGLQSIGRGSGRSRSIQEVADEEDDSSDCDSPGGRGTTIRKAISVGSRKPGWAAK